MRISVKTAGGTEIEVESEGVTLDALTSAALTLIRESGDPKAAIPAQFGFSVSADTERVEVVPDLLVDTPCLD